MSRRWGGDGPCGRAFLAGFEDREKGREEREVEVEEEECGKDEEPIMDRNVRAARMWMGQFPPRLLNTFILKLRVSHTSC